MDIFILICCFDLLRLIAKDSLELKFSSSQVLGL